MAVPTDWTLEKESTQLVAPGMEANLIVSSERPGPVHTTDEYVQLHSRLLSSEFTGFREFESRPAPVFGGRAGYLRGFEWAPPDGVPVTQIQMYLLDESRGYIATVTTSSARFPELEPKLRAALDGVTLKYWNPGETGQAG